MNSLFITASISITLALVSISAKAKDSEIVKTMKIVGTGSFESIVGPVETFTGKVRITMVLQPEDSKSTSCASVAFESGARSAWHSHPKGQLLVVTDGAGLTQQAGKSICRIKKGDVIWTPPNIKHWHGAAPETAITHTAIQEYLNGKNVNWMEKVTDAEYAAKAQ